MFLFSIPKSKIVFFTLLSAIAFCIVAPIINAQTISKMETQNAGPIDPLRFDLRKQSENTSNSSNILKTNKTPKEENISPTAGELDTSLNVPIDLQPGNIVSSAIQADGKIVIGGFFRTLNDIRYTNIARLNTDNSLDSSFSADVNGTVFAIAIQADGKILIGGSFTVVNGTSQNKIARLNVDGSLDTTFNTSDGADNNVLDIVAQPDGKILISGAFVIVNGTFRAYVTRLNADGSNDFTFTSPLQSQPPGSPQVNRTTVRSIALQDDGKIILGGFFDLDPNNPDEGETPVIRLNADGTIDSSFNIVQAINNGNVFDVAVLPDGKILIGGIFETINGVERKHIARLNSDGSLDASFDATASVDMPVSEIYVKDDGKILEGSFVLRPNNFIKQLNADGSLDVAFNPNTAFPGGVNTINVTASGKIFVGGTFRPFPGATLSSAFLFNPDGSQITTFSLNSAAIGGVRAIITQPDSKIIIAGNFNRVNGSSRIMLARLNADGTFDESFAVGTISALQINSLILQPDGKIIVGGRGIGAGQFIGSSVVRLNSDGTLDSSFFEEGIGLVNVKTMALQADGKVLVSYVPFLVTIGLPQNGDIARLNADGSVDDSFTSGISLPFEAIAVQPNGQILVGGLSTFSYVNSGTGSDIYYNVFRLNADGSHDRDFRVALQPEENHFNNVFALKLQDDGKILVGGSLSVQGEATQLGVVRLEADGAVDSTFQLNPISSSTEFARVEDIELLPNGKILAGGRFNDFGVSGSANIARFDADGSADSGFSAATDNAIYDIELQNDGKVLIGGDFEFVNDVARTSLARLISEPFAQRRARFNFDGDNKTDIGIFRPAPGEWWYLRSSDLNAQAFQFGSSTDKIVPADFTGDGKTDIAFFRESIGQWFVLRSEDSSFYAFPFGQSGDIPVAGDFDGDGKADATVFRPVEGTWYILNSSNGSVKIQQFGANGDVPIVEDYDGDGKFDLAVYRPDVAEWYYQRSSDAQVIGFQFGTSGDKAVPADFTGDGKADIAFWRPTSGEWYILRSEDDAFFAFPFGADGDIPVAGDYDGDGTADAAVFRPSNSTWYLQQSTNGFTAVGFGVSGDEPVPSAYIP